MDDNTFRIADRAAGLAPIAINWPDQGASLSKMHVNAMPAARKRSATFMSAASSGTASATANVPAPRSPGLDSPAAWIICAAATPTGRSDLKTT
jgi:hypothetical protein